MDFGLNEDLLAMRKSTHEFTANIQEIIIAQHQLGHRKSDLS
jgi:hypothetical protein